MWWDATSCPLPVLSGAVSTAPVCGGHGSREGWFMTPPGRGRGTVRYLVILPVIAFKCIPETEGVT